MIEIDFAIPSKVSTPKKEVTYKSSLGLVRILTSVQELELATKPAYVYTIERKYRDKK